MTGPDTDRFARLTDLSALAITLDAEGRGDAREGGSSVEERIAIGSVVRTRVSLPARFADSYRGVCLARKQFSCWWSGGGQANYTRTAGIADAVIAGAALPLSTREIALFQESLYLAEGIIGGLLLDRVNGATHYLTTALLKTAPPAWTKGRAPVAVVGAQSFFRL